MLLLVWCVCTCECMLVDHYLLFVSCVKACFYWYVFDTMQEVPYGWKFCGKFFWQIGSFERNPPIFPPAKLFTVWCHHFRHVIMWRHQHVSTIVQTSKEWNNDSPDLVYHQLVPAQFDVLWFKTAPAVFTLLTIWSVTFATILLWI